MEKKNIEETQEIWSDIAKSNELATKKDENQEQWEDVKPKKRSAFKVIVSVLLILFAIFVGINAFLGSANLKLIYDGREPQFLLREETYQDGKVKVKVYHFGVYKIVTRSDESEMKLSLRPWFFDNGDQKTK